MRWTRTRAVSAFAVGTASALLLSACSGGEEQPTTDVSHAPVTISVGYYGNFGIQKLENEYEKTHPWVNIDLVTGAYAAQHDLLQQALITGSGAYTITAVDESYINRFVSQPGGFVNLADLGANDLKSSFMPWVWAEGASPDESTVIGIPNDVYGLALCYRADLLDKAGIDSSREAVSAAVGDNWDDFISMGEKYVAATGKPFLDDATYVLNPAIRQLGTGHGYYGLDQKLDLESIKPAFDTATSIITSNLSANMEPLTTEWNAGVSTDAFAATLCPQWMLGYIQSQVPDDFAGTWDIADIPGPGGNWGGSFFTIPNEGTAYEQQQAFELIKWLVQPEQQAVMTKETGALSAQPALLQSEQVKEFSSEFFNNAPYGDIFAKTVLDIPAATHWGTNELWVRTAVENVLNDVQSGSISVADAWDAAVAAAEAADAAV